jgi:Trypsin-like peptidase domain
MKTTGDIDPREVIGAVFEGSQTSVTDHLGTGSIIGDGTVVLTAAHVIRGVVGQLSFAVFIGNEVRVFPLTVLESDEDKNLALLRIHGCQAPDPLHVAFDATVSYNSDLVTLEYAQTERTETGRFILNPAARRGHNTRRQRRKARPHSRHASVGALVSSVAGC